jgi:hypothetical protein
LIDVPEYKTKYQQYVKEFIEAYFEPDSMTSLYEQYYNLLKDYVYSEETGYSFLPYSTSFDEAVEELRNHVKNRENDVSEYLNQ